MEIPVEAEACHLIIETQTVITHSTGTGPGELIMNQMKELSLVHALLECQLRCDSRYQAGLWMGQHIVRRTAVDHPWLSDHIQIGICS